MKVLTRRILNSARVYQTPRSENSIRSLGVVARPLLVLRDRYACSLAPMSIHIASVSVHACTDEIVPATQGPVHAGLFYLQSLTVILND